MKTSIIKKRNIGIWCNILLCQLLVTMTAFSVSAQIIPANRRVTWEGNVGVAGDIPSRTTIYQTITASSGDRTSTIQSAINACPSGQVVLLGPGTFNITSLTMKSGVTLRGSGIAVTTLKCTSSSSPYLISFGGTQAFGTAYNLSSGYNKESTNISTSSAHGWSAGDIILIDQLNNTSGDPVMTATGTEGKCTWCDRASGNRSSGQLAKLVAPTSGTSATLEMPLYWNYASGMTPQGSKATAVVKDAGVEDLQLDNSTTMNGSQTNTGTVDMSGTSNCWLLRVDVYGVYRYGINLSVAYRDTIRGCKVHKASAYTSDRGYAIILKWAASANLIEDSSIYDVANGPIYNGPVSGNVFAYNYFTNMYSTDYPNTTRSGTVSHGAHPFMNLFEGNYYDGVYAYADFTWGSSSHNTYFRNKVSLNHSFSAQMNDVGVWQNNMYYNFVGNILGEAGYETLFESTSIGYSGDAKRIWVVDYPSGTSVRNTILRHGNWDGYHNNIVWDANITDHNLPDSLYLSSNPAWYGGCTWPPVDPTTGIAEDIPAKLRYEGSSCAPVDPNRPAPPKNFGFK
jgi:hypothetical protein